MITPEKPGDIRYRDRRLLAIYFDMSAMPVPDQLRSLTAAQKFIKTQMQSADLMSIMTYSGGAIKVLNDFTDDRTELLKTIDTLIVGETEGLTIPIHPRLPIPAPPSARTMPSSTSSIPTASSRRCRPRPKCSGSSMRRRC